MPAFPPLRGCPKGGGLKGGHDMAARPLRQKSILNMVNDGLAVIENDGNDVETGL